MITKAIKGKKHVKDNMIFNPRYYNEYMRALLEEGNFEIVTLQGNESLRARLDGLLVAMCNEVQYLTILSCDTFVVTSKITLSYKQHTTTIEAHFSKGNFSDFFSRLGDHLFECGRVLFKGDDIPKGTKIRGCFQSEWYITSNTETI
jgi:hypothetical protein